MADAFLDTLDTLFLKVSTQSHPRKHDGNRIKRVVLDTWTPWTVLLNLERKTGVATALSRLMLSRLVRQVCDKPSKVSKCPRFSPQRRKNRSAPPSSRNCAKDRPRCPTVQNGCTGRCTVVVFFASLRRRVLTASCKLVRCADQVKRSDIETFPVMPCQDRSPSIWIEESRDEIL